MTPKPPHKRPIIARIWRGRTTTDDANEYRGVLLFREDRVQESEFVTISYWKNVDAMSRFAGTDPRRIHHPCRDAEYLIELPKHAQILQIVSPSGMTGDGIPRASMQI